MDVKRFFAILTSFIIVFSCLVFPAHAYDNFGWPIDVKGVGFTDGGVIHALVDDGVVMGDAVRRFAGDAAVYNPDYLMIYIPVSVKYEYITLYASYLSENATFKYNDYGASWGYFESGSFHATRALTITRYGMGTTIIEGNIYRYVNLAYKIEIPSDVTPSTSTFICINANGPAKGFFLKHQVTGTFSGTYDSTSYSASLTDNTVRDWKWSSGSIVQGSAVYITGSYKSAYGGGTSGTQMDKIYSFLASTGGTGGYLSIGSGSSSNKLQFSSAGNDANGNFVGPKGSVTRSSGTISGSLTPTYAKPLQSGTVSEYEYYPILSFQATGVTNDAELVTAVNTGFNRNHADLENISSQLGELVEHQSQVDSTGNNIAGNTSESTISNTGGNLTSGISSLNNAISTASDINSVITPASSYISLVGMASSVLFDFGNGVLLWACVALIVISVLLFILKRISE